MTYQPLIGMPVCHGCHRAEPDMIDASWASGCERHYCRQCWPHYYQNYFAVRFAQSDNDERAAKAADNDRLTKKNQKM